MLLPLSSLNLLLPGNHAHQCPQDGVDTAADKQRRRRAANPDVSPYVPGLCLPKALAPLLPIYLQGILQVNTLFFSLFARHTSASMRHILVDQQNVLHTAITTTHRVPLNCEKWLQRDSGPCLN